MMDLGDEFGDIIMIEWGCVTNTMLWVCPKMRFTPENHEILGYPVMS